MTSIPDGEREKLKDVGGDESPPTSLNPLDLIDGVAIIEPEIIDPDSDEDPVEVLSAVLPPNRQEALRIARAMRSWSGPLPPPADLREYEEAVPGSAQAILADFERRSLVHAELVRHAMKAEDDEIAIMKGEQDLRVKESQSDMEMRSWIKWVAPLFFAAIFFGTIWTLAFSPLQSDWARVAVAGLWLLTLTVICAVVLLRGRYSDNESDVMKSTLPRITDAVAGRHLNAGSSTQPNKTEDS